MYIHYILILNSILQYFTIPIIMGTIVALIIGIIGSLCAECIIKILDRKVEKRYFEIYKKIKKCSPKDFNIAEYNEAYYLRDENFLILEALNNGKNILITGKPKSGKTRTAYESLKTLNGFKVIKFYSNKPVELEEIPDRVFKSHILLKQKLVIFIDDLNKYSEKLDFSHLIKKLESTTKDFLIVATCRSGVEYESIKKEFGLNVKEFEEIKIVDIDKTIGKELSLIYNLNFRDFDGTIGSIFLGIEDMKNRFDELSDEYHVLFRLIKLLNDAETFVINKKALKKIYLEKIKGEIFPSNSFETIIEKLEKNSLILRTQEFIEVTHDCYLDFTLETEIVDLLWLKQVLAKIKHKWGLYNLGNTFIKKDMLKDALNCYQDALNINEEYIILNNMGYALLRLKRYTEALKIFDRAIKLNPTLLSALKGKADALHGLNKFKECFEYINKTLDINSEYYHGLVAKGDFLAEFDKNSEEALIYYDRAINVDPNHLGAFYNKGVTLKKMGRLVEALNCLEMCLEIDFRDIDSLKAKGKILADLNKLDEALDSINETINKSKKLGYGIEDYILLKGIILIYVDKNGGAINCFNEVLEINPYNEEALSLKSAALVNLGKENEAITTYDELLGIKHDNRQIIFNKCNAFFRLKQYDDAIVCYKQALSSSPIDNLDDKVIIGNLNAAVINKGYSFQKHDNNEEAINYFNSVLDIDTKSINALHGKSLSLAILGRTKELIETCDKILEIDSDHPEANFVKASSLKDSVDYEEAINHYEKGLKIKRDPDMLYAMGYCLEKLEKYEYALKCYNESLRLDPDLYIKVNFSKGLILMNSDLDEALLYFNNVLAIEPDDFGSLCNKAILLKQKGEDKKALEYYDKALKIDSLSEHALKLKKHFKI